MRADRLISILMRLQTHTKMTAAELSEELDVTPRTIYRDVTALNVAGVPIYMTRGPGGGIALVESYRTSLTGMKEDEARALFMLSIPDALVQLGVADNLKAALLKLAAALPSKQQMAQADTQQRIYLDWTPWIVQEEPIPHLAIIHQAVWQNKMVKIIFRGSFDTRIEIDMKPLGLVVKMNIWYLIGKEKGYVRVIKVTDILEVQMLDQRFDRDEDFDLAAYWKEWCKDTRDRRQVYPVRVKIEPDLLPLLHLYLDEGVQLIISEDFDPDPRGWVVVHILFENFFQARKIILSLGRAAQVLEPEALKLSVIDFAHQIVNSYQQI